MRINLIAEEDDDSRLAGKPNAVNGEDESEGVRMFERYVEVWHDKDVARSINQHCLNCEQCSL